MKIALSDDKVNQIGLAHLGANVFRKDIDELDVRTFEYQFLYNKLQEDGFTRSETLRLQE